MIDLDKLSQELAEIEKKHIGALEEYELAKDFYEFLKAKEGEKIRVDLETNGKKVNNRVVDDRLLEIQNTEVTEICNAYLDMVSKRSKKRRITWELGVKNRNYWDAKP